MAENIQRSSGRSGAYKLDRGGSPADTGPFIGEVRNNNDPTRSGRVQVWIENLAGPDKDNPDLWRTVSYISPFYGTTEQFGTDTGQGSYVGNKQSYGMWFTPPDIGTQVICFFANGDPNEGYYIGSVVKPALNHMLPAIGASRKFKLDNSNQSQYFSSAPRLPVVEINDENAAIDNNPRFFDETKPVHSVVAGVMLQQGLINDPIRGPIGSNAQRESPSSVYGVSTPGRPIYAGGLSEQDIKQRLEAGIVQPQDATVVARRGGHSFVMDDGDLTGQDQLVRIRTAKGHQITMSDSGDCFFITHANGQTWLEFGSAGTVDIYSSNSINLRSQGDINLHADRSINMNAKGFINIRGEQLVALEGNIIQASAKKAMLLYSDSYVGMKSDGTLSLKATKTGTWDGGNNLVLSAGCIALNSGSAPDVPKPSDIIKQNLPDTKFEEGRGWVVQSGALQTIVTRAPTHEPYPFHGRGIVATADLQTSIDQTTFPVEVDDRYEEIQDVEFDAITQEEFEIQKPATISIGSIEPDQVTGMLAQSSKDVPQDFNEFSNDNGVGKYGLSPEQLEAAGYIKPGTVEFYLTDGQATPTEILSSPSVWTGLNGVTNAATLLSDPQLQDAIQTDLYQASLNQLRSAGVVTGQEDPAKLAGLVQASSKYGADVVKSWVKGTVQDTSLLATLNKTIRSAQYAVQLTNQKISDAIKGFSTVPIGSTAIVNRTAIDQAVADVINNPKVPTPNYVNSIINLYSSVSDADLNYSGNDEIVRANINAERARRGLPPIQTA